MSQLADKLSSEPKTWYLLSDLQSTADGGISAVAHIPSDSPWFSGHFPDRPVLPGIAHVAMAMEMLRRSRAKQVTLLALKRLRFRQAVGPGDRLQVLIEDREIDGQRADLAFQTKLDAETACSGVLTVRLSP